MAYGKFYIEIDHNLIYNLRTGLMTIITSLSTVSGFVCICDKHNVIGFCSNGDHARK
jgi:hypothetical protein